MGCASSKQKRCKHCKAPYSPVTRSHSTRVVHAPMSCGDSPHVVALTSTSLGTLSLDENFVDHRDVVSDCKEIVKSKDFSMGLVEAKTWSHLIDQKIPKSAPRTPVTTPPGEPEMINTWELMAGLEEDSSPVPVNQRFHSFSFDVSHDHHGESNNNYEPMWLRVSDAEGPDSKCPEFDPGVSSMFKKHFSDCEKQGNDTSLSNFVSPKPSQNEVRSKEKVVVYFTSLRGVRKTYEDCCHVLVILKGLRVKVDERDVSMHSGFREELKELLLREGLSGVGLPRVFLGSNYIGGAEEIRRMHEAGLLEKALEGCEMAGASGNGGGETCEACGDVRFVPCETCSGSCKIYYKEEREREQEHEGSEENEEIGFKRCPDCNENGLIRCPICCY